MEAGSGSEGVLGGPGAVLEAYKRRLGGSPGRLGAVLGALEAMLEPSGGQKAPKMEPQRVPNRAPEATRAENCETLIFDDSCKDFNDFSCLRAPSWRQQWLQNGVRIVSSMLKASRSLLTGILEANLALLEVAALGRVLSAIRSPKGAMRISEPPTAPWNQPAGRGWGGDKSLSRGTGGLEG